MAPEFNLYIRPPPPEALEPFRKRLDKLFPLVIAALFANLLLGAVVYVKFWDNYPGWQTIIEGSFLGLVLLSALLLWKLAKIISHAAKLTEAHSVTAHAYLTCANSEFVKSYCRAVIQQGRNLTMEEADMLFKYCTAPDEIARLAAYYEEHAPFPEFGAYGH